MENMEFCLQALYIAKAFADAGKLNDLIGLCGDMLHEDSYYEFISCAWEIVCKYPYMNQKCDHEYDYCTTYIYFSDPVMVEFYRLCKEYGERHRLTKEENPYYQKSISAVSGCLDIPSYSYNFGIITGTAKKRSSGILVAYDDEFCAGEFLLEGLLDAFSYYKEKAAELKHVLSSEKVIPLPVKTDGPERAACADTKEKEAA